jgi:SAM-dependent methyltransferase
VRDFEYDSPGSYAYFHCGRCDCLSIDPVPDAATLDLAYPETYHAYHEHGNRLARWLKDSYWKKKAKRYGALAAGQGRILEFGCSFGHLLLALKRAGHEKLLGVDISASAIQRARQAGLDVLQGDIAELSLEKGSWDLIIADNLLEHISSPGEILASAYDLLRPGGLLVGETPNWRSWDRKLSGRYWGGYHTPRHLVLFSPAGLEHLAGRTGFDLRRLSSVLQPAHWALSVQNYLCASAGLKRTRGRSWLFTPLLLASIPLNLAQMALSKTSLIEFVFQKGS